MRITLVVGLPASGKTHWVRRELELKKAQGTQVASLDDPRTREELLAVLERAKVDGVQELFISDAFLCIEETRVLAVSLLKDYSDDIRFVFFENDAAACLENAKRRPKKPVNDFIRHLSRDYRVPKQDERITVLPVWRRT